MAALETENFAIAIPSQLGWMAILGNDAMLRRLTFGHRSASAAQKALEFDGAVRRPANSRHSVCWNARLVGRLQAYAAGEQDDFLDVKLCQEGLSEFHCKVIRQCRRIPYGKTWNYGQLAARAGLPSAARAVGSVMSRNHFPLIVPCHRVVQAGGKLGNYSSRGGSRMKRRLLEMEGADICEGVKKVSGTVSPNSVDLSLLPTNVISSRGRF